MLLHLHIRSMGPTLNDWCTPQHAHYMNLLLLLLLGSSCSIITPEQPHPIKQSNMSSAYLGFRRLCFIHLNVLNSLVQVIFNLLIWVNSPNPISLLGFKTASVKHLHAPLYTSALPTPPQPPLTSSGNKYFCNLC